jgi:hypothetical protein
VKEILKSEINLLLGVLGAIALACLGPAVAQHAHYHAFADTRNLWGIPFAMDTLSNLPFAVFGVWGVLHLLRQRPEPWDIRRALALVFFVGLVLTAIGSSYYHLLPDHAGLAWDRLGMVVAFAGLLGMAVADRISARSGVGMAALVLCMGPAAVLVWYHTANLLPWVVVQGGGIVLMLVLALRKPIDQAWGLPLFAVVALYGLAKLLELGDHSVLEWTQGVVSGHSLKHLVASLSAWPVLVVMHNVVVAKPRASNPAI